MAEPIGMDLLDDLAAEITILREVIAFSVAQQIKENITEQLFLQLDKSLGEKIKKELREAKTYSEQRYLEQVKRYEKIWHTIASQITYYATM